MPAATVAWLCSDATYSIAAIYNTVHIVIKVQIPLYISARLAQFGTRYACNPKDAGSSPLFATIFLQQCLLVGI